MHTVFLPQQNFIMLHTVFTIFNDEILLVDYFCFNGTMS